MALFDLIQAHTGLVAIALILPVLGILVNDIVLWRRMPPGPPPLPFIGNKREVPAKYSWLKFQEWSKKYGDIYTIYLGRRPTIIISDPNVAVELMEKRSQKYSSRPRFVVMGEIYWEMSSILVQPYGKSWSGRRKLLHSALTPKALLNYHDVQQAEATRLCYDLMAHPNDWETLLDRTTASIVFCIAYGHRIDSMSSAIIRERMAIMHYAGSLNVPGRYLAESIPLLAHIPTFLAPWKRTIKQNAAVETSTNIRLLNHVRSQMAGNKTLPESLTKHILTLKAESPESFPALTERNLASLPASLFGAGSDTTSSTLCSGLLALVTNPHVLAAAHAEFDAVIGTSHLPTFEDAEQLPYFRALCKEILRWRPVAVLGGTPHATSASDTYNGWHIPQGTTILGNSWAINHNEKYYPDSQRFEPLRFLDADADGLPYLPPDAKNTIQELKGQKHPSKLGHSSFGWGRRICPGADLASDNLFVTLAQLLWCFDIKPRKDVEYDIWDYVGKHSHVL